MWAWIISVTFLNLFTKSQISIWFYLYLDNLTITNRVAADCWVLLTYFNALTSYNHRDETRSLAFICGHIIPQKWLKRQMRLTWVDPWGLGSHNFSKMTQATDGVLGFSEMGSWVLRVFFYRLHYGSARQSKRRPQWPKLMSQVWRTPLKTCMDPIKNWV